jgi:hypothetical protein
MLLSSNSRIRAVFFTLATLAASFVTQAQGKSPAHALPSANAHRSHHVFLTRLPRTNKARKYDIFFLNQLPRQATAFTLPRTNAGKGQDI